MRVPNQKSEEFYEMPKLCQKFGSAAPGVLEQISNLNSRMDTIREGIIIIDFYSDVITNGRTDLFCGLF